MEPQAECMLVLIGATPEGKVEPRGSPEKELLGFHVGEAGQGSRRKRSFAPLA